MPYRLNRAIDNGLTQAQAAEVLSFYVCWPNVFSALPWTFGCAGRHRALKVLHHFERANLSKGARATRRPSLWGRVRRIILLIWAMDPTCQGWWGYSALTDLVHCSQKPSDRLASSPGRFPASAGVRKERRFRAPFRSLRYRGLSTCPGL
jgi:hypothetical protein